MIEEIESKLIAGGCSCGAVRYRFSSPLFMGRCYCRDCQRSTGSGHAPVLAVLADDLEVTGVLGWHGSISRSGYRTERGFCVQCGTALIGRLEKNPAARAILAGTLDDTSIFTPQFSMWCESAPPWDTPSSALLKFDRQPPESGEMYDLIRRESGEALDTVGAPTSLTTRRI